MAATIETVTDAALATRAEALLAQGFRLALVAAHHDAAEMRVVYLFVSGPPDQRVELHLQIDPDKPSVPSLASFSFPASRFEREMRDLFGVEPEHHPQPRPLVHHPHWPPGWHPMRFDAGPRPPLDAHEPFPFVTVAGGGVYEIPVGPVHAGLIEPGHFRFSVVGETILKFKARLWYVHKGIEKLFEGRVAAEALPLAERISGDTAVGHSLAFCLALEDALDIPVPDAAQRMRAVLLELERLHNHVADIGMLCNDVAFGIVHAHTQRLREKLLRLNERTTGHRLLRGGIFPGGAALRRLPDVAEVESVAAELAELVEIALGHSVVRERFTGTSVLTTKHAREMGVLGYVARASGIAEDARLAHPFTDYGSLEVPVREGGDVLARFVIRAEEARIAAALIAQFVSGIRAGRAGLDRAAPGHPISGSGLVEGWRGTIAHRIELDATGRLTRVKIVDPSFLTWPALGVALADTIVPDFPLTNKSFNLSYAGNDL
jgi:Ni,Fe-hydrogenase III large subunit/Ni,Fe-hydrogenase III component G